MTEENAVAGPPPGWYGDTDGRERWWDGKAWGEQTRATEQSAAVPAPRTSAKLDAAVANAIEYGAVLESRTDTQATLLIGKPVNHVLHAILSIFTLGLWLLIWLVLCLGQKPTRVLLYLDDNGDVQQKNITVAR